MNTSTQGPLTAVQASSPQTLDRYRDNLLIEACGPILSPQELAKRLVHVPPRPSVADLALPSFMLMHLPPELWTLHIPKPEGLRLAQALDIMMRWGYVHRHPSRADTWGRIYDPRALMSSQTPVQLGAAVQGLSGSGKSSAIEHALKLKPQVIVHDTFPHLVGPVKQLLWLKIDVPPSGTLSEVVKSFAHAADLALGTDYASKLGSARESADSMARRWLTMIASHFPGLLVLDELQNLFKIETKRVRQAQHGIRDRPALRIKDDDALKFILTITNASKIPVVTCSTPDGISAIQTRTSTSQRLVTSGSHEITRACSPEDEFFSKMFFSKLLAYQWLPRKLANTHETRRVFHQLTAGIPRIGIALWIHANQHAIARGAGGLEDEDLRHAASHALAPLQAAVQALNSGDPRRMLQYEDLLPGPTA